jgi:ABC-2 type transport system permease protein
MRKMWLVAVREYIATVKRKGFVITTVGFPLLILVPVAVTLLADYLVSARPDTRVQWIGIVDESGLIRSELLDRIIADQEGDVVPGGGGRALPRSLELDRLPGPPLRFRILDSREEARASEDLRAYYIVPEDFLESGEVELHARGRAGIHDRPGWEVVRRLVTASLLAGAMDEAAADRLAGAPRLRTNVLLRADDPSLRQETLNRLADFMLPYFLTFLFVISIMTSAGYVLRSVAEEKESRVMEILLSSLTTDQLLAGKILGLCGAGLTQLLIWLGMGLLPALLLLPRLDLALSQLFLALVFFLLGFLLFGSLMGATGALGANLRESQQISLIWTMPAVIPLLFISFLIAEPNGVLARVLSFIPLTSPVAMMIRIASGQVPWWDALIAALILTGSLIFFVKLASRLFRLGVLMYGKRPTLRELSRWLRAA